MKTLIKSLILIALMLFILPSNAFALENVPKGAFYFSDKGVLSNADGKEQPDLFKKILEEKQKDTITEVSKLASEGFTSTSISGDLNTKDGISLWVTELKSLKARNFGSTFQLKRGSTTYSLYIPPGLSSSGTAINTAIINNAIAGVEEYQKAVREGVLTATLADSYNTYSMYPSKQVPVTDILEEEKKDGKKTGNKVIKSSGAGVTMNYSLDVFYMPLFGKMDTTAIGKGDQAFWESKINSVKIDVVSGDKVKFTINDDYLAFIADQKQGNSSLSTVKSESIVKTDGVKSYKSTISKKEVKPKSMVDGAMRLIVPTTFSKKDNGTYSINSEKGGYKPVGTIKLLIANNYVFDKDGKLGDFASFGINDKSLVLHSITVNKDGAFDPKGKPVGAVIPLWFKEAVYDTSGGDKPTDGESSSVYLTGRTVKLGNDYSGKIKLDTANKDLFAVDSKGNGKQGAKLRDFAFTTDAKYTVAENHFSVNNAPDNFSLQITFENKEEAKGFVIYRNNLYVDDKDLVKWLESDEAKALTEVKAEDLYSLITGNFETEKTELTYEDWNRLQEIRGELDNSLESQLITIIRVITLVFGVLIIFYSIMLVLAYWIDIFNVMVEFSLLNFMTNKRLYPITSEEDLDYITYSKGDVKYVNFWKVLILMLCGVSIGIVFIYCMPIIDFLTYAYFKITEWVGVI